MLPRVPYYTYDHLRQIANRFLEEYHPSGEIPIPIEEILELKLNKNVIPVPGLLESGVDAYTWSDLKNIVVDEYFYKKNERRLRFTLAHELGHILLHGDFIRLCPRSSIEEYRDYVEAIGEKQHKNLESQADCFAGLVLVPPNQLAAKYSEAKSLGLSDGLNFTDLTVRGYVADWISDFFMVSAQTVDMRMCFDKHWQFKQRKG